MLITFRVRISELTYIASSEVFSSVIKRATLISLLHGNVRRNEPLRIRAIGLLKMSQEFQLNTNYFHYLLCRRFTVASDTSMVDVFRCLISLTSFQGCQLSYNRVSFQVNASMCEVTQNEVRFPRSLSIHLIPLLLTELLVTIAVASLLYLNNIYLKLNSMALVSERTMLTERPPLVGEVVPTFADRGCGVSATDSHVR
jgi:hypothetical protein